MFGVYLDLVDGIVISFIRATPETLRNNVSSTIKAKRLFTIPFSFFPRQVNQAL